MASPPTVSVVIPAHNAAATIARAIQSAWNQDYAPAEVIVVDDASTDGTAAAARAEARPGRPVHVVTLPRNRGASAARNEGIRRATAELIAFLDADDEWLEGKLARQVAILQGDPEVTLVTCNSLPVTADGTPGQPAHTLRPPVEGPEAWKALLGGNFIPTPTVLARRDLLLDLGGFDETLPVAEDFDLWIRLALRGKVATAREVLVRYHSRPASLMKRHSREAGRIVMAVIARHLAEQEARLAPRETAAISGRMAFTQAVNMYFDGHYWESLPFFLRAIRLGHRPVKSVVHILRAPFAAALSTLRPRATR